MLLPALEPERWRAPGALRNGCVRAASGSLSRRESEAAEEGLAYCKALAMNRDKKLLL